MSKKICKECNSEMRLDDRDSICPGCADLYWECDICGTSCFQSIRNGIYIDESWCSENCSRKSDISSYFKNILT